ncbi:SAG family member [Cyclospora cayetanensis]|uniref:SAG family member n=1 Tax=Cyclospora cayetanensis TaxID=88456 RepID=A0A1D3CRX0_9EIME|nr:SAG family member [Cyclospora cayetanensis]
MQQQQFLVLLVQLTLLVKVALRLPQFVFGYATARTIDPFSSPNYHAPRTPDIITTWSKQSGSVQGVYKDCYAAINRIRSEQLDEPLPEIHIDKQLAANARAKVKELVQEGCEQGRTADGISEGALVLRFATPPTECIEPLQQVVNSCLTQWGGTPPSEYEKSSSSWNTATTQACAILLWPGTTHIGCGMSSRCPLVNFMVCYSNPPPQEGELPFTGAQFSSLVSRMAKNVDLRKQSTEGDVPMALPLCLILLTSAVTALASWPSP